MIALLEQIAILTVGGLVGLIAHESVHYGFGRLFGGSPFVSKRTFYIPEQIDFETPHQMTDRQVRIAGGGVVVFPILLLVGVWAGSLPAIAVGAGGSGISMYDTLAGYHPKQWKRFTAGESISRSDFQAQENTE
ncbi:hypothetical protein [Halorubrum sp. CGM4_25_10-8A]|uniref:hypothetical protein n=1 Tax=Halorubrum sp. CGM4_25_10-8A TaxID=2518116 RepID=UPI0010F58714|nr:hypothetical protein [Halorubrum sp. CGM4_25_10-8A]TKX36627.1 hypothetical protein EXE52_16250 [Halorubrum sp. CGM4_25_10-8A]